MSKYRYLISEILILFFISIGCNYQTTSDSSQIKKTIESFYNTQYNAYLAMDYKEISQLLDMDEVQNQNKIIALKNLVSRRKYMNEKSYGYVEKKRFPLDFSYKNLTIDSENATVVICLKLDSTQAYPPFIGVGDNIFRLKKYNGIWKITSHDYEGIENYEISKNEKIPELDIEEIKKLVDSEFK